MLIIIIIMTHGSGSYVGMMQKNMVAHALEPTVEREIFAA